MDHSSEPQLLDYYERQLEQANKERDEAQVDFDQAKAALAASSRRLDGLQHVVDGLRLLADRAVPSAIDGAVDALIVPPNHDIGPRRRGGGGRGPGLKMILYKRLQEVGHLTVEDARAYLATLPEYRDNVPARTTVVARLGDLTREGKAISDTQGEYALSPSFGHLAGEMVRNFQEMRNRE